MTWVENVEIINPPPPYDLAGAPSSFGRIHTISQAVKGATSVAVADVNGDGLNDLISSSSGDGKIAWYNNIAPRVVDIFGSEVFSVTRLCARTLVGIVYTNLHDMPLIGKLFKL